MIFSSARDLGRFGEWLLHGPGAAGAVTPASFAEMKRSMSTVAPVRRDYGLALALERIRGELVMGHGGAIWGHEALLSVAPERGFGVVVLTNAEDSPLAVAVVDHALTRLGGLATIRPEPAARLPEHLGAYVRRRISGEMTTREVVAAGDGIAFRNANGEVGAALSPFRRDVYGTPGRNVVVFLRDAAGRVAGVNGGSRFALKA